MLRPLWFRLLSRLLTGLYYHRISRIGNFDLPPDQPVLLLGLHRNGAVDGYLYKSVIPRATFMISAQLRRSLLGRIFFDGVEVVREKDRTNPAMPNESDSGDNQAALAACAGHLANGGAIFIMPEGTSNLGHRHLPFHKGAARLLAHMIDSGKPVPLVIPVALHYEEAWTWQSDVEIVRGEALDTRLPEGLSTPARVRLLHERISNGLEALAFQAPDQETFARRQAMAYAATLGTRRSYFAALKALEPGMAEAEKSWSAMDEEATRLGLWRHQGVPLVPVIHAWAYPLLLLILAPVSLVACLSNVPPIAAAKFAALRMADAPNTITLWRLLAGAPLLLLWAGGLLLAALLSGHSLLWLAYALVSLTGLRLLRRVTKLGISVHNWLRAPRFRTTLLAYRALLESEMQARGI